MCTFKMDYRVSITIHKQDKINNNLRNMTRIISNIIAISCYKTLFCFGGLEDAKNNFFWNNLYLFKNAYFSKKQNMTTA